MMPLEPVKTIELYEFVRENGPVSTEKVIRAFAGRASPVMALHRLRARGFIERAVGAWTSTSGDSFEVCVAREHIREAVRILSEQGEEDRASELRDIADHVGNARLARWRPQMETKEARL